ncbi:hypothetical protein AVEN_103763-1 [Araneus ventricosus]|uniref:Secreted protein n=1 Tax=Araneus ventricosus TaxID=182803 RepID=A0A4Y2M5V5_ARAVE|nr:hypothetical protein AVEN_103763-1 [Araneus ventricosus]
MLFAFVSNFEHFAWLIEIALALSDCCSHSNWRRNLAPGHLLSTHDDWARIAHRYSHCSAFWHWRLYPGSRKANLSEKGPVQISGNQLKNI